MKKILAFLVTVVIVAGIVPQIAYADSVFRDIGNHWAKEDIEYLYSKRVISGISNTEFEPEWTMTRAQFVKLLNYTTNSWSSTSISSPFQDVTEDDWYYSDVLSAYSLGLVNGTGNDWFGAEDPITREDAATLVARYIPLAYYDDVAFFADEYDISQYAKQAVYSMVSNDLITGFPDGTFEPKLHITRGEAAALCKRVYQFVEIRAAISVGSAKTLEGNCVVFNIFLSDKKSTFTLEDKEEVMYYQSDAFEWLEQQAVLRDKNLNMIFYEDDLILDYYSSSSISTDLADAYKWEHAILKKLQADYDFDSIAQKYNADNIGYILNVNKTGRCYALTYEKNYDNEKYNEIMVAYTTSKYSNANQIYVQPPSVYAHELLHLFGADDLYYPYSPNDERIEEIELLFPYDIMFSTSFDIYECEIDDITEFLIGWQARLDNEYIHFLID